MTPTRSVIIIGAGAGGLAAAMDLSAAGLDVTLVERGAEVGGKMRQVEVDKVGIDAGPTVFTMRWIFEALFARSGAEFETALNVLPADRLARHGWLDGSRFDLWADVEKSAAEIETFSDAQNAEGYLSFCKDSQGIFETLKDTFIHAQKPGPLGLGLRVGLHRIQKLWETRPFDTYWQRLEHYFSDPRLRQLFGRYATYIGSSPFLAPATLMLIAHVEQDGVWLVDGGMRAVAKAMAKAAEDNGATLKLNQQVDEIIVDRNRVTGIRLQNGDTLSADAVVFNGDSSALAAGLLGSDVRPATKETTAEQRSLSALTWCTHAETSGFELDYHTVFFSNGYGQEFEEIFTSRRSPQTPTVYICAQDRRPDQTVWGRERLLILVNAPADGDRGYEEAADAEALYEKTHTHLQAYGLHIEPTAPKVLTGPAGFNGLFPGTGGALYGQANHGAFATFARPGSKSAIAGLYLAGGSAHPGAGVPMATLSGRLAAEAVLADL